MAVILNIDTSNNQEISVTISLGNKKDKIISSSKILKSQAVLPLIDKILRKHKLSIAKIDQFEFNPGPGSYTGLRVGAAIVNSLGYFLQKSVNGKGIGELSEPVYNK